MKNKVVELTDSQKDLFSSISKNKDLNKEIKYVEVINDNNTINNKKELEIDFCWLQSETKKSSKKSKLSYEGVDPKKWNSHHLIKYIRDICKIKYSFSIQGSIAQNTTFSKSIITFFKDFDYIKTPKNYVDWYFANKSDEVYRTRKKIYVKDLLDYFCVRDYCNIMFNSTNKKDSFNKITNLFEKSYNLGGDNSVLSDYGPVNYFLYSTKNKLKSESESFDIIKKFYTKKSSDEDLYYRSMYESINKNMLYTEIYNPAEVKMTIDKFVSVFKIEKWLIAFKSI